MIECPRFGLKYFLFCVPTVLDYYLEIVWQDVMTGVFVANMIKVTCRISKVVF